MAYDPYGPDDQYGPSDSVGGGRGTINPPMVWEPQPSYPRTQRRGTVSRTPYVSPHESNQATWSDAAKIGETALAPVEGFFRGATMGLIDPAAMYLEYGARKLLPDVEEKPLKVIAARMKAERERMANEYPIGTTTGEIIGGLRTGLKTLPGVTRKILPNAAGKLPAMIAEQSIQGAVTAGSQELTDSTAEDRDYSFKPAATGGAVAGGVTAALGVGGSQLQRIAESKGGKYVAEQINRLMKEKPEGWKDKINEIAGAFRKAWGEVEPKPSTPTPTSNAIPTQGTAPSGFMGMVNNSEPISDDVWEQYQLKIGKKDAERALEDFNNAYAAGRNKEAFDEVPQKYGFKDDEELVDAWYKTSNGKQYLENQEKLRKYGSAGRALMLDTTEITGSPILVEQSRNLAILEGLPAGVLRQLNEEYSAALSAGTRTHIQPDITKMLDDAAAKWNASQKSAPDVMAMVEAPEAGKEVTNKQIVKGFAKSMAEEPHQVFQEGTPGYKEAINLANRSLLPEAAKLTLASLGGAAGGAALDYGYDLGKATLGYGGEPSLRGSIFSPTSGMAAMIGAAKYGSPLLGNMASRYAVLGKPDLRVTAGVLSNQIPNLDTHNKKQKQEAVEYGPEKDPYGPD